MLAPARAGKKRHPYHRRRRGGIGARAHSNGSPVLGAIDVGTNACRLLIAVPDRNGTDSEGHSTAIPRVIDSYTANVRLGESLERTGALTEAALDRTSTAIRYQNPSDRALATATRSARRHVLPMPACLR